MPFLVISSSILIYVVLIIIFYPLAKKSDLKRRRLNMIKGQNMALFDEEFEEPFIKRVILPFFTGILKWISNLLPKSKGKKNKSQKLERSLRLAGFGITAGEYNAARLMITGGVLLFCLALNMFIHLDSALEILILIVLTALSVIVPNLYLGFRIKKRQAEISGQLPDVLDLICVSMEAGLGFDAALVRIGERLKGLLVSELNTVHSEIKLGKPRREALRSMSERNSVEELSTFIGSIIQAEQLGIPINNVLKTQAKEIREKRRKESQAKAMKAPVKMMLPLVMFIFPVLFIILLGPTIIDLIDQFG